VTSPDPSYLGGLIKATTELPQQPVAASNSPQTAPLNAIPPAVTASTREATTEPSQQPVAASKSQKAVRSPNQRNHGWYDATAWGRGTNRSNTIQGYQPQQHKETEGLSWVPY